MVSHLRSARPYVKPQILAELPLWWTMEDFVKPQIFGWIAFVINYGGFAVTSKILVLWKCHFVCQANHFHGLGQDWSISFADTRRYCNLALNHWFNQIRSQEELTYKKLCNNITMQTWLKFALYLRGSHYLFPIFYGSSLPPPPPPPPPPNTHTQIN